MNNGRENYSQSDRRKRQHNMTKLAVVRYCRSNRFTDAPLIANLNEPVPYLSADKMMTITVIIRWSDHVILLYYLRADLEFLFSVQFKTKCAVLNGYLQLWNHVWEAENVDFESTEAQFTAPNSALRARRKGNWSRSCNSRNSFNKFPHI